jgi:hypothetical protein
MVDASIGYTTVFDLKDAMVMTRFCILTLAEGLLPFIHPTQEIPIFVASEAT